MTNEAEVEVEAVALFRSLASSSEVVVLAKDNQ